MLEDKLGGETMLKAEDLAGKKVDVGGTPANVIKENPFEEIRKNAEIVVILDPIDNSRAERILYFADGLKFKIPAKDGKVNSAELLQKLKEQENRLVGKLSQMLRAPLNKVKEIYKTFSAKLDELSEKSVREFMNELLKYLVKETYPDLNIEFVLLEDLQRGIANKIKEKIIDRYNPPARMFCKNCGEVPKVESLKDAECCGESALETGSYIIEGGYFPAIIALAGYVPNLSNYPSDSQYFKKAKEVLEELGLPYVYDEKFAPNSKTLLLAYFEKKLENENKSDTNK